MMNIAVKLSTKSIAHGNPCITHILFVTVLSLMKAAVGVKDQGADVMEKP